MPLSVYAIIGTAIDLPRVELGLSGITLIILIRGVVLTLLLIANMVFIFKPDIRYIRHVGIVLWVMVSLLALMMVVLFIPLTVWKAVLVELAKTHVMLIVGFGPIMVLGSLVAEGFVVEIVLVKSTKVGV